MKVSIRCLSTSIILLLSSISIFAQNPFIKGQFSADPTARVFNGRVYIYPSHDILATENKGQKDWFCMEDYHVYSSDNLTDWIDHGVILHQNEVFWVDTLSYSMWAPDCIEKDGKYYFFFPSIEKETNLRKIGVAISDKAEGPFKYRGVLMDESPVNCWTNHHSIVEFEKQWYLFYHHNDYSPDFDKARSICVDSLFFHNDGSIEKVTPSRRGVGITKASDLIQLDRYSSKSTFGIRTSFIDSLAPFEGWRVHLDTENAWVKYNQLKFDDLEYTKVKVRVRAQSVANILLKLNNETSESVIKVEIPVSEQWIIITTKLKDPNISGIYDLSVENLGKEGVEIDWIQFK